MNLDKRELKLQAFYEISPAIVSDGTNQPFRPQQQRSTTSSSHNLASRAADGVAHVAVVVLAKPAAPVVPRRLRSERVLKMLPLPRQQTATVPRLSSLAATLEAKTRAARLSLATSPST